MSTESPSSPPTTVGDRSAQNPAAQGQAAPARPGQTRPGQARPVQGAAAGGTRTSGAQPRTDARPTPGQADTSPYSRTAPGQPRQGPVGSRPGQARTGPGPGANGRPLNSARPAAAPQAVRKGPRKARLTLAQVNPWSVLKLSFLLAVALGIISVVVTGLVWNVIDGMGVFTDINNLVRQVEGAQSTFDVYAYVGFERMVSFATVVAVANVLVLTALSTLFAFLYNIGSGLVGGLRVTLTDE